MAYGLIWDFKSSVFTLCHLCIKNLYKQLKKLKIKLKNLKILVIANNLHQINLLKKKKLYALDRTLKQQTIEGTMEQIKLDGNWKKVEPWKKEIELDKIFLCVAFHLRKGSSLHKTGILEIRAESLDFDGLKGQVQGSGMPKQVKNLRIIPERRKWQERELQTLSTNTLQFCAWTLTLKHV